MKRALAIATLLAGCFGDDFLPNPSDRPDARPPMYELPEGVWEPMPGAPIDKASLAATGEVVWWVVWHDRDGVWLGATFPNGSSYVSPAHISPPAVPWFPPDIAVTPTTVVTKFGRSTPLLRRFDHFGAPLGDAYPVPIENGVSTIPVLGETDLVPTANGGMRLVAALGMSDVAEVAIIDLDANGTPTGTVFFGTPDTYQMAHSDAQGVAAATRADGSTLVAWDRRYDPCVAIDGPSSTLTTSVSGSSVGAIQSVQDIPELGEIRPSIASSGDTAYITWTTVDDAGRNSIVLAKFPDVTTPLAEIGPMNASNYDAMIALAEPGRGAIAYRSRDGGQTLQVVAFTENAGSIMRSGPRIIPAVKSTGGQGLTGIVHVGGDRYVVGWLESGSNPRLFATELDFSNEMLRPVPAHHIDRAPHSRTARRAPCI